MARRLAALPLAVTVAAATSVIAPSAASAQSTDQFYQGKTIRIICALGTGGSYDAYARLVSRHLAKQIAGSPAVVVENMPGAGGIIAANHVYKVAATDGTVLGALHQNTALAEVTGTPNVEYEARRFNWIGRTATGGTNIYYAYAGKGPTTFDDLFTKEAVVAGGGPTSSSVILPSAVNSLMGAKLKILAGYKGTAETDLALERGEVDMALQNWEEIRVTRQEALRDKKINLIVLFSMTRHPELPNLPSIIEKAKTDEQRQVWTVMLQPDTIGYTITAGPDVPADRVAVLRKAFDATMKDAGLKAEAEKAKLEIDPLPGDQVAKLVADMFKVDPSAIATAKKILGR
jgi:tripartite-type tricarboxylate transporter receptor subunit TctC